MFTTSDNGDDPVRLAVIGAGTWGSVLAHIAAPYAQVSLYSATGKNVQALWLTAPERVIDKKCLS